MSKPNFFSTGSPYLLHPLLTPERTVAEIDFVLDQTELTVGGRILDVGCGPGRHCIELARRGYQALGIDPSQTMIAAARERAANLSVQPEFIQIAGEEFFPDKKFDSVICLFTTLGQINDDTPLPSKESDQLLLNRIAKVLISNGTFILEIPHEEWLVNNLKESERFGDNARYTIIERSFYAGQRIIQEVFTLVSPEDTRQYFLRYHLYSESDLAIMLENAGFEIINTYGDYHRGQLTEDSPNMLIVARLMG